MRTIDEHAEAIARLVAEALQNRPTVGLAIDPAAMARFPDRYQRRVLVADVVAPLDLPPFDNSQMDGYAVASSALADGSSRFVVGPRIPAGHLPEPLAPGTAAPIMTGAPVPEGADAIIAIESAEPARFQTEVPAGAEAATVLLPGPVAPGTFVRPAGSDVRRGSVLIEAGTVLRPAHFGVLAASGVASVDVVEQPRVLVISTGAELTEPGAALRPGTIYDASAASLAAALGRVGALVELARISDDPAELQSVIQRFHLDSAAVSDIDLVITTGGVSAGAYEVVRETLAPHGVRFDSVAMQPGGPQGWGRLDFEGRVGVAVVCFPGNPVSTLVSFEAFLRVPLVLALGGEAPRRDRTAPLAEGASSPIGKHQIRRGRLDDDGRLHLVGGPSSHLLNSYAQSTVLAHIPIGVDRLEAGDDVVVWGLDD